MAKWARVQDGKVAEVTDIDPEGRFHPSLIWVECPEEVDQFWSFDGKKFTAPPPPPPITAESLAPGFTLEGLTDEEIAAFEALAAQLNSDPSALLEATTGE